MDFSPFHQFILASGSADKTVKVRFELISTRFGTHFRSKLWELPQNGLEKHLTAPKASYCDLDDMVVAVKFHPSAENVLAVGTTRKIAVIDIESGITKQQSGYTDAITSLCWNYEGR